MGKTTKVIFLHLDLYLEISALLNQLINCFPLFLYLSSSHCKAGTRALVWLIHKGWLVSQRVQQMGSGALLAPALFQALFITWALPLSPPKICFQACPHTGNNRCPFSSSLNLEKGSFLVYFFVVLEWVSQLCTAFLWAVSPHPLLPSPHLFF